MNLAALEAVLPSFTAGAVTAVTNTTWVYVNDRARVPVGTSEVAWEFVGEEIDQDGGGLGLPQARATYRAIFMAAAASLAVRKIFVKELVQALLGARGPVGLTDLDHCEIGECSVEGSGIDTLAGQAVVEVIFVGDVTTSDAGA